jgi:hypothetical protein
VLQSLGRVFELLCGTNTPSRSLEVILHNAPLSLIPRASQYVVSQKEDIAERGMKMSFSLPHSTNTSQWIRGLLQGLIDAKRFTVITRLIHFSLRQGTSTHSTIDFITLQWIDSLCEVFHQLYIPNLRRGAFQLLEYMLLGYQHSPDVFHALVPLFTHLFQYLINEKQHKEQLHSSHSLNSSTSTTQTDRKKLKTGHAEILTKDVQFVSQKDLLYLEHSSVPELSQIEDTEYVDITAQLSELVFTLMYHFTGYPELYSELLKLLKQHNFVSKLHSNSKLIETQPQPLESAMRKRISENAWTNISSTFFVTCE